LGNRVVIEALNSDGIRDAAKRLPIRVGASHKSADPLPCSHPQDHQWQEEDQPGQAHVDRGVGCEQIGNSYSATQEAQDDQTDPPPNPSATVDLL